MFAKVFQRCGKGMPGGLLPAVVMFVAMLCVASPLLVHADNLTFCHALYLNGQASADWLYPSYLLSWPLAKVAAMVSWVNVYLLYLYILVVGSASAVLHVACPRGGRLSTLRLAGAATAAYIVFQVPMNLEYAWISFLAAGCGCMLVFHALYNGGRYRDMLPGVALFVGGALLRHDSCLGFIPFIAVACLFCFLPSKTDGARGRFPVRGLAVSAFAVLFLGGVYLGHWQGDPHLPAANQVRMSFCDYPDRSGADKAEEYRAIGMDESSVQLLEGYFCRDESVMTLEWWERAGRVRRMANPVYRWDAPFREHTIYILGLVKFRFLLLAGLAIWGACIRKGWWRLYPLAMAAAYFAGILICCAKGRCYITPIMSLAYFYVPMLLIPCGVGQGGMLSRLSGKWVSWCTAGVMLAVAAVCLVFHSGQVEFLGGFTHRYKQPEARRQLVAWVGEHPDSLILADCYTYRDLLYPDAPLFSPRAPYTPRVVEFGNWPSALPYRIEQQRAYGIDNEVKALLLPHVRLVAGETGLGWLESVFGYLRGHYGENVQLEKEYELPGGYAVYRIRSARATQIPH